MKKIRFFIICHVLLTTFFILTSCSKQSETQQDAPSNSKDRENESNEDESDGESDDNAESEVESEDSPSSEGNENPEEENLSTDDGNDATDDADEIINTDGDTGEDEGTTDNDDIVDTEGEDTGEADEPDTGYDTSSIDTSDLDFTYDDDFVAPEDGDHSQSELVFSHLRGYYEEPFTLEISHSTATQVDYTMDSSNPLTSEAIRADLPLSITIDPTDTTNRYFAPGVVIRAIPVDDNMIPERISTHTYLFATRIVELSPDEQGPGGDWPEPSLERTENNGQWIDYGMDPEVVNDPDYADQIVPAMLDIPSVSLVTDLHNLFDEQDGIFVNAEMRNDDPDPSGAFQNWEREGSLEIIYPGQTGSLQANTGIRIRGGWSRNDENPKHAFKCFFRGHYGVDKVHFPLFGSEGPDEFDRIDFRTSGNYSWSFEGSAKNTMNRDVFSRDLQRELGQPYTRSRYYHLYLDGVYWGLFQSQERVDSDFAKTYFDGEKDQYDVIKSNKISNELVEVEISDGDDASWREIYDRTIAGFEIDEDYYALEGRGPDGERDYNMKILVDIDNLIDHMLVTFYTGNYDGPTSKFFDNVMPNNFYGFTNRVDIEQGYVFFAHDSEHTLRVETDYMTDGVEEDRVNIGTIDFGARMTSLLMDVSDFEYFHPQWLHFRLSDNGLYRERFATRAKETLENGPLTPSYTSTLFQSRAHEINLAIIAESARWGDVQSNGDTGMGFPGGEEPADVVFTKNDHWLPALETIITGFFPVRTEIVIEQLRYAGLYPD